MVQKQTNRTIAEKLYCCLAVAFGLFWLAFLVLHPAVVSALRVDHAARGRLYLLLAVWFVVTLLYGVLLYQLQKWFRPAMVSLGVFVLCALPRLVVLHWHHYIPTNDFANYLLYGQCFVQGNLTPAAALIANYYQMPKMGGLVVFNGLLMNLFGTSLLGLQLANIIITGLIGVLLYQLLRPVQQHVAWLTALLWMVYPSNIISTQIPTNHHGAVLFFLLALLLYQQLLRRQAWLAVLLLAAGTGLCLTISNFIHPSVIVVQLSILCFTLLAIGYYAQRQRLFCKQNQKLLVAVLVIFLTGAMSQQVGMQQLIAHGIVTDDKEITVLFKLVLGFNPERGGSYVEDDYVYIRSLPTDEQAQACLRLLRERVHSPLEAVQFMLQKTNAAWFQKDGYFYWYHEGALQTFSAQQASLSEAEQQQYWQTAAWIDSAKTLDLLVVRLSYWLAVVGLFTIGRRFTAGIENVLFFIPLGWVAVIMLTEMQSRYRYPAMPVFFCLAAFGIYALWQWGRKKRGAYGNLERESR